MSGKLVRRWASGPKLASFHDPVSWHRSQRAPMRRGVDVAVAGGAGLGHRLVEAPAEVAGLAGDRLVAPGEREAGPLVREGHLLPVLGGVAGAAAGAPAGVAAGAGGEIGGGRACGGPGPGPGAGAAGGGPAPRRPRAGGRGAWRSRLVPLEGAAVEVGVAPLAGERQRLVAAHRHAPRRPSPAGGTSRRPAACACPPA